AYVMPVLFLLAVGLWMLWRWLREARLQSFQLPKAAVWGVLVALALGAGLYAFVGYQQGTKELLESRSFYAAVADGLSAGGELAEDEVGDYFQTNEDVMHFALLLPNRMAQKPTAAGWLMLSNIYANMGAFEQAKEAGYAAFAHDDSLDNQMWLAQIALQENGGALNAEAFMHIRSVINAAPERNNAWLTLAMAATEAKDYDLAEEAWLELYRRNKGNVETEALFERSLQHVREQREIHAKYSQIQVRVEADETIAAGGSLFVFLRYE